ncbi:MAG: SGNH/GDSL hydrolase family protein [Burkholderiaceae bacterium]
MTKSDLDQQDLSISDKSGRPSWSSVARRAAITLAASALAVFAISVADASHAAPPVFASKEMQRAQDTMPAQCKVPDGTAFIEAPLPRLARRLKSSDPLTIVVIGSGSAAGSGTSAKDAAFPYRLETRFAKAFAKARTRLVVFAEMGQTAPMMFELIAREVVPMRPALVVWQTGSADAVRGIAPMEFGTAVERGIGLLHDKGSDVLLIDSQFSPRASLLVNTDAYRDAVRWNARRFDVALFKRYDTMHYWWSNEIFDLDAEQKADQLQTADRIHDCVAALLVRLIVRGIGTASAASKS